jgi:hypothetical protein
MQWRDFRNFKNELKAKVWKFSSFRMISNKVYRIFLGLALFALYMLKKYTVSWSRSRIKQVRSSATLRAWSIFSQILQHN